MEIVATFKTLFLESIKKKATEFVATYSSEANTTRLGIYVAALENYVMTFTRSS